MSLDRRFPKKGSEYEEALQRVGEFVEEYTRRRSATHPLNEEYSNLIMGFTTNGGHKVLNLKDLQTLMKEWVK